MFEWHGSRSYQYCSVQGRWIYSTLRLGETSGMGRCETDFEKSLIEKSLIEKSLIEKSLIFDEESGQNYILDLYSIFKNFFVSFSGVLC